FCNKNSASDPSFPYPNGQISDGTPTTFAGLDVGDAANGINLSVLWGSAITSPIGFTVAPATFDIMTYCNQPQWVSAYHYEAIRQRLLDENPGFTQLRLTPLATGMLSGSLVHVVATLNLTKRSGSIVYITPVRRAVPTVGPTGRAELVARDSNGNELYRRSVPIKLISD